MNHFKTLFAFLILFALSGCLQPVETGDDDPMHPRSLENKPVQNPHELMPVVPVQTAHGWWTNNNNIGNELPIDPDSTQRQTILNLPEMGPPQLWTISLYMVNNLELFNGFDVEAEINFGAGGTTQIVKIDWLNGTQITLPMNAVNVVAVFKNFDILADGAGARIGVQVAKGNRPGGGEPPVLTISENLTVLKGQINEQAFDIPRFAKKIRIAPRGIFAALNFIPNSAAANLVTITTSTDRPGTSARPVITRTLSEVMENGIEVTGSARTVVVTVDGTSVNDFSCTLWADIAG